MRLNFLLSICCAFFCVANAKLSLRSRTNDIVSVAAKTKNECLGGLKGTFLGKGEWGNVYALEEGQTHPLVSGLDHSKHYVFKVINNLSTSGMTSEVRWQQAAGELTAALPVAWKCTDRNVDMGVVIMERMIGDLKKIYPKLPADLQSKVQENMVAVLVKLAERGIDHRDAHFGNWGVDEQGRVRILDFGMAKHIADSSPQGIKNSVQGNCMLASDEMRIPGLLSTVSTNYNSVGASGSPPYSTLMSKTESGQRALPEVVAIVAGARSPSSRRRASPLRPAAPMAKPKSREVRPPAVGGVGRVPVPARVPAPPPAAPVRERVMPAKVAAEVPIAAPVRPVNVARAAAPIAAMPIHNGGGARGEGERERLVRERDETMAQMQAQYDEAWMLEAKCALLKESSDAMKKREGRLLYAKIAPLIEEAKRLKAKAQQLEKAIAALG